MRSTLARFCLILVAGAATGIVVNAFAPWRIPYIATPKPPLAGADVVGFAEAQQLWGAGVIFLDARPAAEYAAGHIPNALNLPAEQYAARFSAVSAMLSTDMPLVVYCDGVECELSHQVQQRLVRAGYRRARVLVNGWTLWRQAGRPVTTGATP
jgi:rhodanese-related sulfurtransferase